MVRGQRVRVAHVIEVPVQDRPIMLARCDQHRTLPASYVSRPSWGTTMGTSALRLQSGTQAAGAPLDYWKREVKFLFQQSGRDVTGRAFLQVDDRWHTTAFDLPREHGFAQHDIGKLREASGFHFVPTVQFDSAQQVPGVKKGLHEPDLVDADPQKETA